MKEVRAKSCEQSKMMNEFTVVALKRNLKQISRKIPLFAAVISYVDASISDPSIALRDPTGSPIFVFDHLNSFRNVLLEDENVIFQVKLEVHCKETYGNSIAIC